MLYIHHILIKVSEVLKSLVGNLPVVLIEWHEFIEDLLFQEFRLLGPLYGVGFFFQTARDVLLKWPIYLKLITFHPNSSIITPFKSSVHYLY